MAQLAGARGMHGRDSCRVTSVRQGFFTDGAGFLGDAMLPFFGFALAFLLSLL